MLKINYFFFQIFDGFLLFFTLWIQQCIHHSLYHPWCITLPRMNPGCKYDNLFFNLLDFGFNILLISFFDWLLPFKLLVLILHSFIWWTITSSKRRLIVGLLCLVHVHFPCSVKIGIRFSQVILFEFWLLVSNYKVLYFVTS